MSAVSFRARFPAAGWLPLLAATLAVGGVVGGVAGCGRAAAPPVADDARATFSIDQTDAQGDPPDVPVQYQFNVVLRGPRLEGELLRFEFPQDAGADKYRLAIWPLAPAVLDAQGRAVLAPASGPAARTAPPDLKLPVRVRDATDAELDVSGVGRPDAATAYRLETGAASGRARPPGAGWRAQAMELPPGVVVDLKLFDAASAPHSAGLCSALQQALPSFSGPGAAGLKPLARAMDATLAQWTARYDAACATTTERLWAVGLERVRMVQPQWLVVELRGATTTPGAVRSFEGEVFNYDLASQRVAALGDWLLPDDLPALGRAVIADADKQLAAQGVAAPERQRFVAERVNRPEPWDDWRLTRAGLVFRFYLPALGQRLSVNMAWDRLGPWLKRGVKMPDGFNGGTPSEDSGAFAP